jgi:putative DNA primase/helicase
MTTFPSPRNLSDRGASVATLLSAALSYIDRWSVFPTPPSGEKMGCTSAAGSNGNRWGATKSAAEIHAYWQKYPWANLGIATGKASGLFVVEADSKEGHNVDGIAALAALEAAHGALPDTLMAESPTGSRHYYFNNPPGLSIHNSASIIALGVDVRGEGGMVIAPPSVRPGVGRYRWLNANPIVDAPDWLLKRINKLAIADRLPASTSTFSFHGDAWLRGLIRTVATAGEGQRNCVLYWAACRGGEAVRAGKASEDFVIAVLLEAALHAGLEGPGALATIASGLNRS